MTNALIIFFKLPEAGKVKTRLTPFLSPEAAAMLYAAFVKDTLLLASSLSDTKIFAYLAAADETIFSETAPFISPVAELRLQRGAGLGERMSGAFKDVFELGFARVSIIGSDAPHLPKPYLTALFDSVATSARSVSIGPSEDGGYYGLSMNAFTPEVFLNVNYSSPETYRETLKAVSPLPVRCNSLPIWFDIDEPQDLKRLSASLDSYTLPHTASLLPHLIP
ncbi:MAG: TIGR04282 family arsenosugar biosynthesis glycosyltransferase [Rhizobacter sp.]|nr:TIGR04282 family arsenosugar biosynthesis glycosyltransferase [Chlorobiales bacterium]